MDTHQFNSLGGFCELVGVGFVARDLVGLAQYRGILKQAADRFRVWWAKVVAKARRLLWWQRRPSRSVSLQAHSATTAQGAGTVTLTPFPGPFKAQPGQSLEAQVAALAELVNRLRGEIRKEPYERERAISVEREARRKELRSETERLERLVAEARQETERLRRATTGDLRLRAGGLVWLVAGIILTTWSQLSWLPFRLTAFAVGTILVAQVSWPYWSWLTRNQAGRQARRVGPGAPWLG